MEKDTKLFLGKILGEIYRIQLHSNMPCAASNEQIYGLLKGFEEVIDEQLDMIGYVSNEDVDKVVNILDEITLNEAKLNNFKGFYDIESNLCNRKITMHSFR